MSWPRLLTDNVFEADVMLMGVPFDGAVTGGKGAALAPAKIRELSEQLSVITEDGYSLEGWKVFDWGDPEYDLDWERYYKNVENLAQKCFQTQKFCICLGGDHSISIPLHKAYASFLGQPSNGKTGIIHIDSHPDLCSQYDNHPWSHACTERRAVEGLIKPEGLTLIGTRAYTREEVKYLGEHPEILNIGARQIWEQGVNAALALVIDKYVGYDQIYLSIDIDAADPAFAPGTGTPEAGGLSSREILELIRGIVESLPIRAMDIVEVSPPLDQTNQITSWLALKIIYETFGVLKQKK